MSASECPGYRFDGQHAEAVPVEVRVEGAHLVVEKTDGVMLDRVPVRQVSVSDQLDRAPRVVWLPNGATLEVADQEGRFAHQLRDAGFRPPLAVRLQRWWPAVLTSLVGMVAGLFTLYLVALPKAAHWVAFALPPGLEARMGAQVLTLLDRHYLKPSRLDASRQAEISNRLARAAAATAPGVPYRLEFRTAGKDAVNAMALPGGIIILLDGLVAFADDDDAVLGVLGHELGHVVHKHAARRVVESLSLGTLASLLWGDFSGVAASVPVVVGMLHHSRAAEREADEVGIRLLRDQGISVEPLLRLFEEILDEESAMGADKIPGLLQSHPATAERIARLRREIR